MNVVKNELVVGVDIDGTLIRPCETGSIKMPYGSKICSFEPIVEHVDLVKSWKNRGYFVIVWSHGGWEHAQHAVRALKLERFVDLIITKPSKHLDDKEDVGSIVGQRVFII